MNNHFFNQVNQVYRSVTRLCPHGPNLGIVTGSGLSGILEKIDGIVVPYKKIARFPQPTVKGHPGLLKVNSAVAVCGGRFHAYEGFTPEEIVLPVFLLHKLGVKNLILTNAAGGIREDLKPGSFVLLRDQINLTGLNPLKGRCAEEWGSGFVDMTEAYSKPLREKIRRRFPGLHEGVYAGLLGPSYETPAEIRMLESMGADLVGMSTVLETIAARFLGMEVVGVSLVTNRAAGKAGSPLSHRDVIEAGEAAGQRMTDLLGTLIELLTGL